MSEYLSKEEIKQWRSSLEKITLEEFAARLGKEVEESKPTNDVVDIVMTKGTSSNTSSSNAAKVNESFSKIAERAFERERQISHTPFSIGRKKEADVVKAQPAPAKKVVKQEAPSPKKVLKEVKTETVKPAVVEDTAALKKEPQITLKRALTDREQMVFDYFLNNVGKTVFAKDLAVLLDLPRDYVYKYIKNLRAKIEGDKLRNVPSGGFILTE